MARKGIKSTKREMYEPKNQRFLHIHVLLSRSQAIYGSSVETFGPYPQDYTTLKLYLAVLCYYPTINFLKKSTKNEHSYKRMFVRSVFLHIIPIQLLQVAYL
jgi:hypothetical protein